MARSASARSADGQTIIALLPPSSSKALPKRWATRDPTERPIPVERRQYLPLAVLASTWAGFLGFDWPALPSGVITIISVITLALLLAVLFRRLTHRVLRLLSNFDDYFSWFITTLVIVTGLMATAHLGGRYETLLGLHILSFDVLLIWFPLGKLMHAFYIMPSRAINGYLLSRKGAPS